MWSFDLPTRPHRFRSNLGGGISKPQATRMTNKSLLFARPVSVESEIEFMRAKSLSMNSALQAYRAPSSARCFPNFSEALSRCNSIDMVLA